VTRSHAALCASIAAAASVGLMPAFISVDESIYRWLQFHRTCQTAAHADMLQQAVVALVAIVIVLALATRGRHHPGEVATGCAVVASGAVIGEILKTVIERVRPRSLPTAIAANSFPSGHVMNTALIVTAAYLLVRRSTAPRWLRVIAGAAAVAAVAAQAAARVLRGSHWPSDVPGSVLVAVAWTLAASTIWRLPPRARVAAAGAALGVFAVAYYVPTARITLPSALDDVVLRATAADAPVSSTTLPGGDVSEQRLTVIGSAGATVLKMALQAQCVIRPRECCASVATTINQWEAPPLTITSLWHEFHLAPPAGVLRAGANTVVLRAQGGCGGRDGCTRVGVAFARVKGL